MGTLTLAHFCRRFERELGSRKFLVWLLESNVIAILLVWMVASTAIPLQYAGPYPSLGALLYLYYKYTPRLYPRFFGMFGFHVSEKVIPYAFLCQVILFRGMQTILPAACGVLGGWLAIMYTMDVPDFVADFFCKCASFMVDPPPPLVAPALVAARQQRRRQAQQMAAPPQRAAPGPPPPPQREPPSQANIDQLTAMGFDRDTVVRALEQTNNSVERALDRLLTGAG